MEPKDKKITQADSARIQKVILELRDRAPKSKEELGLYLIKYYGVYLAKKAIDPENSSPLDFVWDVYSTAMGFEGANTCYSFLGMAARGSQKSLSCAVLECLLLTHDKYRDWFHMASIKEQSYVTYQYFKSFLSRKIMAGVASEPTMRETISKYGRHLKIGTATMDSVNGHHGCIAGHSVVDIDGVFYTLDEVLSLLLVKKTRQIESFPSYKKLSHIAYRGEQQCIRVILENGFQIDCTPNHEFLYHDGFGFGKKEIGYGNFKVGDSVFIKLNWDNSQIHDKFFDDNIAPVRIKSIEKSGVYRTYDIQVEDGSQFWCPNGIVVSNSLVQDELDLTPAQIFNESKGMLSAQHGRMPLNIAISSRKFAVGNIQTLLDKTKKDKDFPLKIHSWGILEVTEKCLPDRHGEFGQEIYVNEEDLIALSPEEYENVAGMERSKYDKKIGYKNCLKCGIFSFCQGRLPNQDSGNPHLQPINLTRDFFKTDSLDFFKSQRLNKKPSTEGLIYGAWDEDIHVKSYGQMWEIFHGEPHPDLIKDPVTGRSRKFDIFLEELVGAFFRAGCKCVVGVDFGFSVLAVCGLYFIDGSGRVYFVDELSYTSHSDAEVAAEIKRNWGHFLVDEVIADPESPGGQKEIQKATDWGIRKKVDKNVKEGIESMRRIMRTPGTRQTRLFVSLNCTVFREEVKTYRNKIDPRTQDVLQEVDKKQDHCFTEGHEILTDSGWKYFKDLDNKDKVASVLNDKTIKFEKPFKIVNNHYEGDIYNFKNENLEFSVTENHRIVAISQYSLKKSKSNIFSTMTTEEAKKNSATRIPMCANGGVIAGGIYNQPFKELGFDSYEWGYYLGIFLSEGCTNLNYNHYRTNVYQKKQPITDKIDSILGKCGVFTKSTNKQGVNTWQTQKRKYYDYFVQFGKSSFKYIPRDVLNSHDHQLLKGVFDGLMDGDGSVLSGNNDYNTTSVQLANDFSELCSLLGYSSSIKGPYARKGKSTYFPIYKIRVRSRFRNYPNAEFRNDQITKSHYSGQVYCVGVESGMILCRHNGRVFVSGNSLDQARYVIHTIFGGNQFDGNFNPKDQAHEMKDFNINKVERAPTATELAGVLGATFSDNRDDFYYDPETKTYKSIDDKKDKGPDTGGNSGFSFSF